MPSRIVSPNRIVTALALSTALLPPMLLPPCFAADAETPSTQTQMPSTQTQVQSAPTQPVDAEPLGTAETPSAAAQAEFSDQKSHAHPPGGLCFLEVLQAISGKKCAPKTVEMFRDVVEISRQEDRIVVVRIDSGSTSYPRGTEYGDRIFASLDEAEEKLAAKLGAPAARLIHDLHKISLQGKHVQFIRTGPETLVIQVPRGKHYIPVTVKQLELGAINMDLDLQEGYPRLRNIEGVRAVVKTAGVDLSIDLREFARRKDKQGNTHLTFGVKSWIPAPMRFIFGLPAVLPFHYMLKKKPESND